MCIEEDDDSSRVLTREELEHKYNFRTMMLHYNRLIHVILRRWKRIIKAPDREENDKEGDYKLVN